MQTEILTLIAVLIVSITSLVILTFPEWRTRLISLGVQYAGVFLLIINHWPLVLGAVLLFSGWISTALLAIAIIESKRDEQDVSENLNSNRTSQRFEDNSQFYLGRSFQIMLSVTLLVDTQMPGSVTCSNPEAIG